MHEVNNDLMILLMQISTQTYSPNRNRNKVAIITPRIRLKRHNKISLHSFPTVDNILWNNQLIVQWGASKELEMYSHLSWNPLENSVLLPPVCWLKKALAVNQSVFTFIFQSLEFLWNNKDFAALTASSINSREIFKLFTLEIRRTSSILN